MWMRQKPFNLSIRQNFQISLSRQQKVKHETLKNYKKHLISHGHSSVLPLFSIQKEIDLGVMWLVGITYLCTHRVKAISVTQTSLLQSLTKSKTQIISTIDSQLSEISKFLNLYQYKVCEK